MKVHDFKTIEQAQLAIDTLNVKLRISKPESYTQMLNDLPYILSDYLTIEEWGVENLIELNELPNQENEQ